ncbi:MAG: sterol desaturase family protein, partial [Chitinophagia bacterium]|nr:sterol desaturase family protein [Chitinophagia bacterium]
MNAYYERIIQLFSLPIYAFFIPLEIILAHFAHRHYYTLKETAVNIYLNLLAAGIDLLLRGGALIILYYFYGLHPKLINLPPAAYWVILLIGEDFLFWLEHFVDHHCRLFWAV